MPRLYLVAYEYSFPDQDYAGLIASLQALPGGQVRLLPTLWLIETDLELAALFARLQQHFHPLSREDGLFIIEVSEAEDSHFGPLTVTWHDVYQLYLGRKEH